jgi:hypothetical protein
MVVLVFHPLSQEVQSFVQVAVVVLLNLGLLDKEVLVLEVTVPMALLLQLMVPQTRVVEAAQTERLEQGLVLAGLVLSSSKFQILAPLRFRVAYRNHPQVQVASKFILSPQPVFLTP